MDTINEKTLERYLQTSTLTEDQKNALRKELKATNGDRQVLNKAIALNGRKSMTKVPTINHK